MLPISKQRNNINIGFTFIYLGREYIFMYFRERAIMRKVFFFEFGQLLPIRTVLHFPDVPSEMLFFSSISLQFYTSSYFYTVLSNPHQISFFILAFSLCLSLHGRCFINFINEIRPDQKISQIWSYPYSGMPSAGSLVYLLVGLNSLIQ